MTTVFAEIIRSQRERGGLLIEATLTGDPAIARALDRACGASLTEMGRGEEIAGRLLRVVAASASKTAKAGRITLYALVTGARAVALAAERVYKGLSLECEIFGDEISEIALVDRPINKSSLTSSQKLAVIYKRSGSEMSLTSALHKYYGTRPSPSPVEVDAAWQKMTSDERALVSIKATLARPATGGRDFINWYARRANGGDGNPIRRGGEFFK